MAKHPNEVSVSFGDLEYCALVSEAQREGVSVQDLIRERVGQNLRSYGIPGKSGLSPREREVAKLVAEGLSNERIGRKLGISAHTAHFHVSNIMFKIDVDSRAGVAAAAVRMGLA